MSNNLWTTTDASVEIHLLPGVRWFVPVATELVPAPNHYSRSLGPAGPVPNRLNDSSRVGRLHGPVDCPCAPNPKAGRAFSVAYCVVSRYFSDRHRHSKSKLDGPGSPALGPLSLCTNRYESAILLVLSKGAGGSNGSLAKTTANVAVQFLRSLVGWHVGSAGSTRVYLKARLHLSLASTATGDHCGPLARERNQAFQRAQHETRNRGQRCHCRLAILVAGGKHPATRRLALAARTRQHTCRWAWAG